ncbi:MAG: hypothetical protein LBL84_03560 [Candidatus Nomurabacteria bacterium]|jgi:hypothetical protein|nr:hypothetical protein [Candidatus Nomurabacteria bacterium]
MHFRKGHIVVKQDEFTKLFKYMEKRFDESDAKFTKKFDDVNERLDRVEGMLETNVKNVEDKVSGVDGLTVQVDRHERYFDKISGILKVNLDAT